jgi:hypothetical protein
MKTGIHYTENGMKLLRISHVTPFDQTDARKFLFVYLAKATDKSSFTNYINKRLETIADDRKLSYLEQVKIHSEKAQRENKGLTATQTQWFDDYLQGFNAKRQPTAQHKEQPTPATAQHDTDSVTTPQPDEQHPEPQPTNDEIIATLPALYDILIDHSVIDSKVSKADFVSRVLIGNVKNIAKKTGKFKAFVKVLKPYFNCSWYDAICDNMGLTTEQMGRYNSTDNSVKTFEKELQKKTPK